MRKKDQDLELTSKKDGIIDNTQLYTDEEDKGCKFAWCADKHKNNTTTGMDFKSTD